MARFTARKTCAIPRTRHETRNEERYRPRLVWRSIDSADAGDYFFFFNALTEVRARDSALNIRVSSLESSAKLSRCFLYSTTVAHPQSDLSAKRICFCLSENNSRFPLSLS